MEGGRGGDRYEREVREDIHDGIFFSLFKGVWGCWEGYGDREIKGDEFPSIVFFLSFLLAFLLSFSLSSFSRDEGDCIASCI